MSSSHSLPSVSICVIFLYHLSPSVIFLYHLSPSVIFLYHLSLSVICLTNHQCQSYSLLSVNVSVTFLTICQLVTFLITVSVTFLTICQLVTFLIITVSVTFLTISVCHIPCHLSMFVIFFTVNVSVIFLTICQCLSYFLLSVIVSVIFFIICHCLFVCFFFSFLVLHCPSWTIQVALPALHGYGTAATGAVLPFLPVCAVFSCVPTMVWLSVSEICNVRIDVGASDCTRVLYGHHESLHSKLALGGKALAAPGTQKACWHYTFLFCWMLYQLSHPCFHSKFLSLSHSLPAVNLWDIPYHLSRLVSW